MKRLLAAGAGLAALTFIAACGGGDAGAQQQASAQPAAAASAQPASPAPADSAADQGPSGRSVFSRTCQTCHQASGLGLPGAFPPLANSPIAQGDKDRLIRLVLHGLQGPITVEGKSFNNVMPPWKTLSDAEIAAVLTYVRSNFGNTASAVTPAEVAAERTATSSRTQPWTAAELGIH